MAAQFDFYADIKRQLERLKEQLIDPNKALLGGQKLMKWIGAQGVAVSQKAFLKQELGDIKWPARYPNQDEPKFNYAGALMDWKSGRASPKPNRFQDRPAVVDEGMRGGIQGSLTFRVTGPLAVRWGSGKDYARLQHDGGYTSIPFDKATLDRMLAWLYKAVPQKRKTVKPEYKGKVTVGRKRVDRGVYAKHVHKIVNSFPQWDQTVIARPFVGITDTLEKDFKASIKMYFDKFQR